MSKAEKLSTKPYKGVRDFYPEDMAIERYIFDTWSKTAEAFGYARYDASILEPAELYKSKGAENEEIVNEQTYTFTDRGKREVTLRPEMTPTVARMIAGRQRELAAPIRWYSIPNLFRYERAQRGRLREHWQLNCDIFGVEDISADIEIISLAYQLLTDFGASPDMFEIRINSREFMDEWYTTLGITEASTKKQITKLNDRKNKISDAEYLEQLRKILPEPFAIEELKKEIENTDVTHIKPETPLRKIIESLQALGITNVILDKTIARGFDYYTGTIFEVFDTNPDNNRAMLGGGRYNNLTGLFSEERTPGIGFGMGDVTMLDFLTTHQLLPEDITNTGPTVAIVPTDTIYHLVGQQLAQSIRVAGFSTAVDISERKRDKKISRVRKDGTKYLIVVGEDEVQNQTYSLQDLQNNTNISGTLQELLTHLTSK